MSDLTDEMKSSALSSNVDYMGVGSIDRSENAPNVWRPNDFLENCPSIISLGLRKSEGFRIANQRAYAGFRRGIYVYIVFGYTFLNEILNLAAFRISRLLEKESYLSIPIPAARPAGSLMTRGLFSNRNAAVAAGLGEFGLNGLLVTSSVGRVRLASKLIEPEFAPDSMYSGEKICDRERYGKRISVCPTSATSENECVQIEMGSKTFNYAKVDEIRCRCDIDGLVKEALGRQDIQIPENATAEDYLMAFAQGKSAAKDGTIGKHVW